MPNSPKILIPEHHRADRSFRDYNDLDIDTECNVSEMNEAQLEAALAKRIGAKLMEVYPQRRWSVLVNVSAGFAQVMCPSLATDKGYVLHLNKYHSLRDLLRKVVIAGGEVLERYGISRSRAFDTDSVEALERDFRDEAISPDSGVDKRIIVP